MRQERGHGDRARARRADASRPVDHTSTSTNTTAEARALRIAKLYVLQRRLEQHLGRLRAAYDIELLHARREQISYAVLGDAVLVAIGVPRAARTADTLARVENSLGVATHAARIRAAKANQLAHSEETDDADDMLRLKKRVIEYYADDGYPPSAGLGGLDDDLDLDVLDERLRDLDRRRNADASTNANANASANTNTNKDR